MPLEKTVRRFYNAKAWREQRARILQRSQLLAPKKAPTCECSGQCGRKHICGETAGELGAGVGIRKGARVVITVAHVNRKTGTPAKDDELLALCTGCHLRYDRVQHLASRKTNRRKKLEARGQGRLL